MSPLRRQGATVPKGPFRIEILDSCFRRNDKNRFLQKEIIRNRGEKPCQKFSLSGLLLDHSSPPMADSILLILLSHSLRSGQALSKISSRLRALAAHILFSVSSLIPVA